MRARNVCASAPALARWIMLALGAALLALASRPNVAATFTYTNPLCSKYQANAQNPQQIDCVAGTPGGATFTYTNSLCTSFQVTGQGPQQTITCITGRSVPVCSPQVSATTVAQKASVTITANCSGQPTSWTWQGAGCSGQLEQCTTTNKGRSGTVTITISATNASGTGPASRTTVTWTPTP